MARRSRTRRVLKWGGLAASVFISLCLFASARLFMAVRLPGGTYVSVSAGDVSIMTPEYNNPTGVCAFRTGLVNWNNWEAGRDRAMLYLSFPVYVVLGAAMLWTVLLFRSDRRRRFPSGHCQKCGYNLTGNVSGRCPECGAAAPLGGFHHEGT